MARNLNNMIKIGDYLRLEQQVVCYEASEIAHIENVMIGETRERKNTYLEREERITESESVSESEQERDTQTSERYAMQRESQKIMSNEMNFDVSLSVSGKAGPVVMTANTGFAMGMSTQQSDKNASDYAKNVVERARNRTFQRTRNYEKLTIIKQWEDINLHSFKNEPVEGEDKSNNVGIYRWVDKKYKNSLMNYGRRLMLNLVIPDPAAWHRLSATFINTAGNTITCPVHPSKYSLNTAADINENNFMRYCSIYGVSDIRYPDKRRVISSCFAHNGEDADLGLNNLKYHKAFVFDSKSFDKNIAVEDDYQAVGAHVKIEVMGAQIPWGSSNQFPNLTVYVGDQIFGKNSSSGYWFNTTSIFNNPLKVTVPVSIVTYLTQSFAVHVNIETEITPAALEAWKLKLFNTIMEAYNRQLAEYERKLNALKETGSQKYGNNPTKNRIIEQQELKKGAIAVLGNNAEYLTYFDDTYQRGDYPFIKTQNLNLFGGAADFLENAFEWDLMSYSFFPYFWQFGERNNGNYKADTGRWSKVYSVRDNDDTFEKFLQAGYAQVVLSVKPGHELEILNYLENGVMMNSNFVSKIPIVQKALTELAENNKPSIDDPTLVDEWHTKAPTNLVILQTSAKGAPGIGLPCWESDDKRLNPDLITLDEHFGPIEE
jgi:hypothetical protein